MSRICYVNGEFVPEEDAKISIFDRGFIFADAVYDASAVVNGKLVDNEAHLIRLQRSMKELRIPSPATNEEFEAIELELIERNNLDEGIIYMQVSRGAADRDFPFPKGLKPTVIMFPQFKKVSAHPLAEKGMSVVTAPDIRWQRRDIKAVALLAACMAKTKAAEDGVGDTWFVEDGYVTEGSSNNAFIVTHDGKIVTRQLGSAILPGITRKAVMALAEREGLEIEQRAFTPEEAYAAREAFSTSASTFVIPVVKIDNHTLGNGVPGPVTVKLRRLYLDMARNP